MLYPAVILTAMIIIGILMFIFVVPTLLKTFTELHIKLPATTQVVLDISNLIRDHGLIVLIVFIILASFLVWWSKRDLGRKFMHALVLKIPVIGLLVQEVNTARTARTMSSLLGSGVDVVETVNITADVVQNIYFKDVLTKASASIKNGDLMSKTFNQYTKYYPLFFIEMMSVGEETGKTGEMLLGVAKYYEDDVNQKTKDMSTIIEPVLILMIGGAVGFFAVSMIQPMYSLMDAI
jgi:type IV pilus assembly protein PilC